MGSQIVTEAQRQRTPPPKPANGQSASQVRPGQKVSQERGTATRNKKNPGKRPHQGG